MFDSVRRNSEDWEGKVWNFEHVHFYSTKITLLPKVKYPLFLYCTYAEVQIALGVTSIADNSQKAFSYA